MASATLTHKSSGRSLALGALLIRRNHRDSDTVLLTTGLALGMAGPDIADLYFSRWSIQENSFRDGEVVDIAEHRGNCGRMVANIAVETELERLVRRDAADRPQLAELAAAHLDLAKAATTAEHEHHRASSALATRRGRLDRAVEQGRGDGRVLGKASVDHHEAMLREEATGEKSAKAQRALQTAEVKQARLEKSVKDNEERRATLEPQRRIREIDVAQDTILTAVKLTLSLLIAYVLREYLPSLPMSPATFASRVFGLSGRREVHATEEHIVFYENPRDPPVNQAVSDACRRLNARNLEREGRVLRYRTELRDDG